MPAASDIARELRTELEQYFAKVFSESDVYPEVKWLCQPAEIDAMILKAFEKMGRL